MKFFQISIDGPSGVGKSTVAKKLAKELDILNINTGKIFRAIAWYMIENKFSCEKDAIESIKKNKDLKFSGDNAFFNEKLISENELKKLNISKLSSKISKNLDIRKFILKIEHSIAKTENVIMEGRDIGTNVFPDAILKIYLYANIDSRAKWRYEELKKINLLEGKSYETIKKEMSERDKNDIERELNPLKKANDAIEIDTSKLSIDELVKKIKENFYEKIKIKKNFYGNEGNTNNEENKLENYSKIHEISKNLNNFAPLGEEKNLN